MHTGRHRRLAFRRMHMVVALVIAGLLAIMLPKVLAPKAVADPGDWTAAVQAVDATELAATPSGVYALHCASSSAQYEASYHAASTGAQQHVLPTTSPKVYPCDGQKAVAADGTLYGVTDADSTVAAYKAGARLFARTLVGNGDCTASRLTVTKLSMGIGGKLWATAREANYNCPAQSYLFALSATSGEVQANIALGSNATRWMQATATGVVVLTDGGQGTLRYFNAAGSESATQAVQLPTGESVNYPRVVGSADGTVYLPVMREHSADATCNQGNLTTSVLVYGASGKKGAYQLPSCASISQLAAGSWGAALYGAVGETGGIPSETLITIGANAAQLSSTKLKETAGGIGKVFVGGATHLLADAAGNLVVLRKFSDANGYDDTLVQVTEPANGTVRQEFTTESFAGSAGFTLQDAALGKGYLYLLGYRCEGTNAQGCPIELHGIAIGGMELEAPFGNLLSGASAPPAELEFAFAGDSFISGEGIKPFLAERVQGQLCHRSKKAWPILVDSDVKLGVKISGSEAGSGFVACSGATSFDILNGSSSQPQQLMPLKAIRAKRVVISIGGNDIGFADQIIACILGSCEARKAKTTQAIQKQLPKNLTSLIKALKAELGDDLQLYFVGYPQVLPKQKCSAGNLFTGGVATLAKLAILSKATDPKVRADLAALAQTYGLKPKQFIDALLKGDLTFSAKEAVYAGQVTEQLNDSISRTVTSQGAQFINPNYAGGPFQGRHLCPAKGKKSAFNGFFIDAASLPNVAATFKNTQVMSFHPNESGAKAYLEVFRQYLAKHPQK